MPPLPLENIGNPIPPSKRYINTVRVEYLGFSIKIHKLRTNVCSVNGDTENGKGITIYEQIHSNAINIAILVIDEMSIFAFFMGINPPFCTIVAQKASRIKGIYDHL